MTAVKIIGRHGTGSDNQWCEDLTKQLLNLYNQSQSRPFRVALSGGNTPLLLFKYWREHPNLITSADFHFFWVDERMVPAESNESNYGCAYRTFFGPCNFPQEKLHPITFSPQKEAEEVALQYSNEVKNFSSRLKRDTLFELIILGMGDDGHTSSIFPNMPVPTLQDIYIPTVHPVTGVKRVALSFYGIRQCENLFFHITGAGKAKMLSCVLEQSKQDAPLPPNTYPAARAMYEAKELSVFLDSPLYMALTEMWKKTDE